MPQAEDLSVLRHDPNARPSFVHALRGYERRQVDEYVSWMDRETSKLAAERERAVRQAQELTARLEAAQAELTELHQRPPELTRASFRDLGPTVDQILALAEKQATEITDAAAQRAAEHQAEAARVLAEAQQLAERLQADGEAVHERARQAAQRINEQSARQLEEARTETESMVEAARAQTQQEIQARQQALVQLQGELNTAQQQLAQTRQETAAAEHEVAQLQQRIGELGQELARESERVTEARRAADAAERRAVEVRTRVQREAERVAQLASAAVMAAAARGAETGEYPVVLPGPAATGEPAETATTTEPPTTDGAAPSLAPSADGAGGDANQAAVPAPREAQPW